MLFLLVKRPSLAESLNLEIPQMDIYVFSQSFTDTWGLYHLELILFLEPEQLRTLVKQRFLEMTNAWLRKGQSAEHKISTSMKISPAIRLRTTVWTLPLLKSVITWTRFARRAKRRRRTAAQGRSDLWQRRSCRRSPSRSTSAGPRPRIEPRTATARPRWRRPVVPARPIRSAVGSKYGLRK